MNGSVRSMLTDLRRSKLQEILVAMRAALHRCGAGDDLTSEFGRLLDEIEDRVDNSVG